MVKTNLKSIAKLSKLMSLKKIQKKIAHDEAQNLYKVLILLAVLAALYFIHQHYLVKEGMVSSAEDFEKDIEGKKALVLFHADWSPAKISCEVGCHQRRN